MGQYYIICNIDKKQYLVSYPFGDGAKLMEFGMSGEGMMTGLAILLADGNHRGGGDLYSDNPIIGTWAGDRIVIAGDYADEGRFVERPEYNLYHEVQHLKTGRQVKSDYSKEMVDETIDNPDWEDISVKVIGALLDDNYYAENARKQMTEGYRTELNEVTKGLIELADKDPDSALAVITAHQLKCEKTGGISMIPSKVRNYCMAVKARKSWMVVQLQPPED